MPIHVVEEQPFESSGQQQLTNLRPDSMTVETSGQRRGGAINLRKPGPDPITDPANPAARKNLDPRVEQVVWNRHGQMGLINPDGSLVTSDRAFYLLLFSGTGNPLSDDNRPKRLIFPVNPEDLSMPRARSHQAYDIVNGPQTGQAGQLQLRVVTFSSFFPAEFDEDYCVGRWLEKTPRQSWDWVEASMLSRAPLRFIVQPLASPDGPGIKPVPDMTCYVTSFSPGYRAGNPLDVFFDIELTEHRDATITRVGPPTGGAAGARPQATWKFRQRQVARGDTLTRIAVAAYGRSYAAGWKWIRDANHLVVQPDPPGHVRRQHVLLGADGQPNPGPNEALQLNQLLAIPKPKT